MKRVSVWLLVTVFGLATLMVPFKPAFAATSTTPTEGINLQISPLPIEFDTAPGTSVNADLRVRNIGSETEHLQIKLLKVSEDDNGVTHLVPPGPNDTWVKWVSFNRTAFDAPSNEWQDIKMTVNVPKSAAFGYYFAVEYLRAKDIAEEPGKAIAHGAVATFILLNADIPGAKRQAQLVNFVASHKTYEFLPVSFSVKIRNTGNVHVAPYGNIFIFKGSKQIDSIDINQNQGNVLPDGSRFFTANWNNGFPVHVAKVGSNGQPLVDKNDQPVTTINWNFAHANRLRFGHYKANLVMIYNNGQRDVPLDASVQFWVIPWRLIGVLLFTIVFVGIGLWVTFRKSAGIVRYRKKSRRV
ncbi:MAG TPA: hypothetical protein VLG27_03055 [Candidatus Saccharimonadia bacterium]|nr:hypothetical protein [Candidatus Saccharimonadia bacterium]